MDDFYKEDSGISEVDDLKSAIKKAKGAASDLRKKLDLPIPLDVHSLIQLLGLPAKAEDFTGRTSGLAQSDANGNCFIMYNSNYSKNRQRFTIAHEIGHILLEHVPIGGDSSQCSEGLQEKEANAFASELLVPAKDLRAFTKAKNKTIEDIISRYKVSKEVALCAINECKLLMKIKTD